MITRPRTPNRRIALSLARENPLVEAIDVTAARAGKTAPEFILDALAVGPCAAELARIEARKAGGDQEKGRAA